MKTLLLLLSAVTGLAVLDPLQEAPKADKPAEIKLPALLVGDPAPELGIDHWVRGGPIEKLAEGQVYLVTVCGDPFPQADTFLRLQQARAAHGEKAPVVIVTCSYGDEERAQFLAEQADKIAGGVEYTPTFGLAWEKKRAMDKSWRKTSGHPFPLVTFLVDKHGKIAWIGDRDEIRYLEPLLTDVVADKHDIAKLAAEYKAWWPTYKKVVALKYKIGILNLETWIDAGHEHVKELLDLDPARSGQYGRALVRGWREKLAKPDEARAWASSYLAGAGKDNAEALNEITLALLSREAVEPEQADYELSVRLMTRAVALSKEKNADYLYNLAYAQVGAGDLDAGIATQRKSAALDPANKAQLEKYERMKQERAK